LKMRCEHSDNTLIITKSSPKNKLSIIHIEWLFYPMGYQWHGIRLLNYWIQFESNNLTC
jgi:hypothetical protein